MDEMQANIRVLKTDAYTKLKCLLPQCRDHKKDQWEMRLPVDATESTIAKHAEDHLKKHEAFS